MDREATGKGIQCDTRPESIPALFAFEGRSRLIGYGYGRGMFVCVAPFTPFYNFREFRSPVAAPPPRGEWGIACRQR